MSFCVSIHIVHYLIALTKQMKLFSIVGYLDKLQLSQNDEIFNASSRLFLRKWEKISTDLTAYFKKEWITSRKNWHEGYRHKTPSTNNGQESHNKNIKDEHTLRERLDLSQFRVILFSMIEQWSVEYSSGLNQINYDVPSIELE